MPRKAKKGKVYSFAIGENLFAYFQYLGVDDYQLGGDCVIFFNYTNDGGIIPDIKTLTESGILYVTLTVIQMGKKSGLYKALYDTNLVIDTKGIKFKDDSEGVWDEETNKFIRMLYIRSFGSSDMKKFSNRKEYEEETSAGWKDGVMLAEGQKERILDLLNK